MNHIYVIDDGGSHWYSAENKSEALALMREDIGSSPFIDDIYVKQLPDDEPLGVIQTDIEGQPKITKLAKEWAENYKGCVATTEY